MASRLLRLRAMTSALPTGLVALVTLPRTWRKAGRGASDCAGTARITMAEAIAIARSLRIVSLLLSQPASLRRRLPRVTWGYVRFFGGLTRRGRAELGRGVRTEGVFAFAH